MNSPQLVFAENSPYGTVEAIIEQDDHVAFFYLRALNNESFGMKSCWVRNLVDAPEELDRARLSAGNPPVLPARFCRSASAQSRLQEKTLRVVWFEEGDGAALLEDDETIAIIPAWSGVEGFEGYSKECVGQSPFGWEMPGTDNLENRIKLADQFWKSWQTEKSPWDEYEPRLLESMEKRWGPVQKYFSIDGGEWPPRTLAQFAKDQKTILVSVGTSICPQPRVEMAFDIPGAFRRFELAACFEESESPERVDAFARYMSSQVALPWQKQTFFAHGHSVSCRQFLDDDSYPDFSSIFLVEQGQLPEECQVRLPEVFGDPVNLLWTVPVFEHERKQVQESNNLALLDSVIREKGIPLIHRRASL